MSDQTMMWLGFAILMTTMFILDLGVFSRKSHEIRFREAIIWTLVWVSLAFAFNVWIYLNMGPTKALEFFTGYLIEESLSVDNLFVFILIFNYFNVDKAHQPKILKWGIIGALVMRGIFIFVGIGLIERFHWMVYAFGGLLLFTGIRMAFDREQEIDPETNPLVRLVGRFLPIAKNVQGDRFFIREKGKLVATPLFLALLVVESTDVIFAVDSIPAVLAVTTDPFIVYTSNVFAILGLRALFFLLAGVMEMFHYLRVGLSFVLCFVGIKMVIVDFYKIPIGASLGVVAGILLLSILASVLKQRKEERSL